MSGQDYLKAIKANLTEGRHQSRMGENILGAFGYVRRRETAISEIKATLEQLGLVTVPPIHGGMPLRTPRIRFSLAPQSESTEGLLDGSDVPSILDTTDEAFEDETIDDEEDVDEVIAPSFRISEIASANGPVECVSPDAPIQQAYTMMELKRYSQLVVAGNGTPRSQDIKGIISYQSMAKATLSGGPAAKVRDCIGGAFQTVPSNTDLKDVVPMLVESDVVLVIGKDHRLQGIVTSWDLAEEFAQLVDPFMRIGEIEARLRTLVRDKIGHEKIAGFLSDHGLEDSESIQVSAELTMGELQRVLEYPVHWECLSLIAIDRSTFIEALDDIRKFRNRLMHFRGPLTLEEMSRLTLFCELVREIPM